MTTFFCLGHRTRSHQGGVSAFGANISDIISPLRSFYRIIQSFHVLCKLTGFVTADVICKPPDPPRPDAIYFLASQSIVWPYWQPAGNFTCPKTGSPVVPVKFGLGSSWISTWKTNGSCAAYTPPNYKDAQRVAFVPNKPPFLNNLNVPLRRRSGTSHRALAAL